jgi:hypothetical protein
VLSGLTGTGTYTLGANTKLIIRNSVSVSILDASSNVPNTVEYNGAVQNVVPATYYNLKGNNSGAKSLTGNTIIAGNLDVPLLDINGQSLTINGTTTAQTTYKGTSLSNLTIGSNAALGGNLTFISTLEVLNNLTINKTGNITLGSKLLINGLMSFSSNGKIITTINNKLTLYRRFKIQLCRRSYDKNYKFNRFIYFSCWEGHFVQKSWF